jgi:putative ABC transport system permease protein
VAGRAIGQKRYEAVVDRTAGLAVGETLVLGRHPFTVVGLTGQMVSSGGDPALFLSLIDAQELQFKKSSEAIRNDRARVERALLDLARVAPALASDVAGAVLAIAQSTHIANAIALRLGPGADALAVAREVERWKHYAVLTAAEQERILTRTVIEKARRQLGLFTVILLVISTVVVALIIYTLTVDKIREIATLKLIGAPGALMVKLILQQSLALGAIAFAVGAVLIHLLHGRFPRRVVLLPADQLALLAIVSGICIGASLLGIRRALAVEPLEALGG